MNGINITTKRMGARGFGLLAAAALLASCSVDTAPQLNTTPEKDVRNYYIQLAAPKMQYQYSVASQGAAYVPTNGQLTMNMKGLTDSSNGKPVYGCLWSYTSYGTPTMWYYTLDANQAVDMGVEVGYDTYTDHWVDLQSPLAPNASWTFVSKGETITASVVKYGVTATVEGKSYDSVIMVNYNGAGTTGTEWFAKGKGLIFSHIERPGAGTVENHLLSIEQK